MGMKFIVSISLALSVYTFASENNSKAANESSKKVKVSGMKKKSSIGRDAFFLAVSGDKYFPNQMGDYKREFREDTNSDIQEQEWSNLHKQHNFDYVRKVQNKTFAIEMTVNDWSDDKNYTHSDVKIYPKESEAQMQADPFDIPSLQRYYRVGSYFVHEKDANTDSQPSSVNFYFKNSINVQMKSYQLKPKEMVELIKKTSFEKLGEI
jgi:hypothetical protein